EIFNWYYVACRYRRYSVKWKEIHHKYPGKFILIGDVIEEKISESTFRIVEGTVLEVSDDPKVIRSAYKELKEQGKNVLYSIPATPDDFIVENVPFMGILS
ncbi:MAG TPA: hypothetical protein PK200_12060, partial [Spirochaetota bacterium]|nr:hypothetical protein [Spirochaetota bacterium]